MACGYRFRGTCPQCVFSCANSLECRIFTEVPCKKPAFWDKVDFLWPLLLPYLGASKTTHFYMVNPVAAGRSWHHRRPCTSSWSPAMGPWVLGPICGSCGDDLISDPAPNTSHGNGGKQQKKGGNLWIFFWWYEQLLLFFFHWRCSSPL